MTSGQHKTRTLTQNACLHKWCELIAETLNDAGFDQATFLEKVDYTLDVPWTKEAVKEIIWRPVQKAMTQVESTTEARTVDYIAIEQTIGHRIGEKLGIQLPEWPDRFNQ